MEIDSQGTIITRNLAAYPSNSQSRMELDNDLSSATDSEPDNDMRAI